MERQVLCFMCWKIRAMQSLWSYHVNIIYRVTWIFTFYTMDNIVKTQFRYLLHWLTWLWRKHMPDPNRTRSLLYIRRNTPCSSLLRQLPWFDRTRCRQSWYFSIGILAPDWHERNRSGTRSFQTCFCSGESRHFWVCLRIVVNQMRCYYIHYSTIRYHHYLYSLLEIKCYIGINSI